MVFHGSYKPQGYAKFLLGLVNAFSSRRESCKNVCISYGIVS